MSRPPNYLLSLPNGRAYFRISIPRDLYLIFKKRELKQRIEGLSQDELNIAAYRLGRAWRQIFNLLREYMYDYENSYALKLKILDLVIDAKSGITRAGSVEFDPENVDSELKSLSQHLPKLVSEPPPTARFESESDSIPISKVIEEFCAERESGGNWSEKTARQNRKFLDEAIEILGDVAIDSVDKSHARQYKKLLLKLPVNYKKRSEYKGLNVRKIAALAASETPSDGLSPTTVNIRIQLLGSMLNWARDQGYCDSNPFTGLSIKRKTRPADRRDPFTDEELNQLFGPKGFVQPHSTRPNRYWIPLVALYTGARLEEIAQLDVADVCEIDGIWCIDINDADGKKLKTEASKRVIPIHQQLLDLGFLDFVESQSSNGHVRLFPELTRRRDGYGQSFQKWFGREKDKLGFPKSTKTFHSLRHTVVDRLRNAGVEEPKVAALVGHRHSTTTNVYGSGYDLNQLKETIDHLDFSDVFGGIKDA